MLFDPVLSARASPFAHFGPKRSLAPPCDVHELPEKLDAVCFSNGHYDHLDTRTVRALLAREGGGQIQWMVPLGNRRVLEKAGVQSEKIQEMDWWDSFLLGDESALASEKMHKGGRGAEVRLMCTPAQHGSCRTPFDRNKTLWSSWVVQQRSHLPRNTKSFFFGG